MKKANFFLDDIAEDAFVECISKVADGKLFSDVLDTYVEPSYILFYFHLFYGPKRHHQILGKIFTNKLKKKYCLL